MSSICAILQSSLPIQLEAEAYDEPVNSIPGGAVE